GTHGKTTTTALTAYLLGANGSEAGYLIGGVPLDPPTGNHLGAATAPFVIEGDEYDSAFFDKRSKFIHYAPHIAVLNNLEFDHADIFRDLADVQRTFSHLTRIVPRNGWILLNGDDDNLRALGPLGWTHTARVGTGERNDLRIVDFTEQGTTVTFKLVWQGRTWGDVSWSQPGLFNARNAAMAALAAGLALCPEDPTRLKLAALTKFRGVKRRQELLIDTAKLKVIEDFGHHPTALAETLHSLRNRYPDALLTAVFEPRSNTARTKVMQAGFTRALGTADEVFIGAVSRADRLKESERFDVEAVTEHLETQGVHAHTAATNELLLEKLSATVLQSGEKPQVVIFFTNGSFDGIIGKFVEAAK
ncbi:MAG: UDP-N-acetylmuramate: L-alanyl-gamma-D-glutamyl-meso-diaminopimelate ligase, partial [Verrucomicrobia bacterium]